MSSSPRPFQASSPTAATVVAGDSGGRLTGRRSRSRFTFKQLQQLATGAAPSNPLRVIAHVDLDAFYAQCEMVRLGVPDDQPLAVQQWYLPPPFSRRWLTASCAGKVS